MFNNPIVTSLKEQESSGKANGSIMPQKEPHNDLVDTPDFRMGKRKNNLRSFLDVCQKKDPLKVSLRRKPSEDSDSPDLGDNEEENYSFNPFQRRIHEMKVADWNKTTGLFQHKGSLFPRNRLK